MEFETSLRRLMKRFNKEVHEDTHKVRAGNERKGQYSSLSRQGAVVQGTWVRSVSQSNLGFISGSSTHCVTLAGFLFSLSLSFLVFEVGGNNRVFLGGWL